MIKLLGRYGLILSLLLSNTGFAQDLSLHHIFSPGVSAKVGSWSDTKLGSSSSYLTQETSLRASIPLKTRIDLNLKRLNLGSSQSFLTIEPKLTEHRFTSASSASQFSPSLDLGYLKVKASIRNGFWFYSVNGKVSKSMEDFSNSWQANGYGYLGKLKIKSLSRVKFYGLSAGVLNNRPFVLPFYGMAKKWGRWSTTVILPVQAHLTYKKGASRFRGGIAYQRINSAYYLNSNDYIDDQRVNAGFTYLVNLGKTWQLKAEAQNALYRKISIRNGTESRVEYDNLPSSWYFGLRLSHKFGKSLIGQKANELLY